MPDTSDFVTPLTKCKILIFIVLAMNKLWGILNNLAFNAQLDQSVLENHPENYGIR